MKHAVSLMIVLALATVIWMSVSPVGANGSFQSVGTPTPTATRVPLKQPTLQPPSNSAPVLRSTIAMTRTEVGSPGLTIVSANFPPTSSITVTTRTLKFPGLSSSSQTTLAPSRPKSTSAPGDFVDNWELLVNDDFEGTFPITSTCVVWDFSADGFDRKWGKDSVRATSPTHSIWPARDGANGVDPATNNYPTNLDSWLKCGPYSFSNAQRLMVRYTRWLDIPDPDVGDFLFVGASIDGTWFNGVQWWGVGQYWVDQTVWLQGYEGQPQVWIALVFRSDADATTGKGAWIDDFKIWRYNNPAITCGNSDPGNKGVVLNPYEQVGQGWYPVIRSGGEPVVQRFIESNVKWVRMGFLQKDGYAVDEQAYDRIVDTLCNAGISVLGLVNHETLTRPATDADDPAKTASYRSEFANQAGWLAGYFKYRVTYWEIWNEENYDPNPDPNISAPPSVRPAFYAPLLNDTYNSIKTANPNAKVLFGGLGSAWRDSNNYFRDVYDELQSLGGVKPFDYFAIHPYFNDTYGLDPQVYMKVAQEMNPGDQTVIDKFVTTMQSFNDPNKRMWITEVGWNSAVGAPGLGCLTTVVVTEQQQANYLKKGFDILFNEVPRVDKVIWYQYIDTNAPACGAAAPIRADGMGWKGRVPSGGASMPSAPSVVYPWRFGLYRLPDLGTTPKPSQCAFKFYPNACPQQWSNPVFLPLILRGQ